jgi:hypothetical protein
MGEIFVEGLGTVQIEGSEPTEAESKAISQGYEQYKEQLSLPDAEKTADAFLSAPSIGRFVTEVGLSIAGSVLTGGLALPGLALRAGMLARPFLTKLATSSLGSGAGGGIGAGVSQLFDPKDDITREILRGAAEGAVGEAVGVPVVMQGGKLISKIVGKTPSPLGAVKEYLKPIEGAHEAEQILFLGGKTKEGKEIVSQADQILANPEKYTDRFYDVDKVKELALEAKKGLTMGMKTESRALDTLENISTGAFFGADELIARKEALAFVGQTAQKDFLENMTNGLSKGDMGKLFFDTLSDGQAARKAYFNGQYKGIDELVRAELGLKAGQATPKLIPGSLVMNALKKYSKDLQIPGKDVLTLQKTISKQLLGKRFDFKSLEKLRSELGQNMQDAFKANKTDLAKAYQKMREAIDDTLENSEALTKFKIPEVAVEQLKRIRKEYRETAQIFDDGVVATILKKGKADGGVDEIFNAIVKGKDKPDLVQKLKLKINDLTERGFLSDIQSDNLNDSLKGQFLSNIFERSKISGSTTNPMYTDFIDASKALSRLKESDQVFKLMFTKKAEQEEINNLLKNLAFSQGTIDQKTGLPGKMFIQLKQAGAIGNTLSYGAGMGLLDKGAAMILIAPAAMTKIMLNPKINKFLFQESTKQNLGKTSPTAAGVAFRQLVGRLVSEGLVPEEDGNRAIEESKVVQKQYEDAGIKSMKDIQTYKQVKAASNLKPVNTQVTSPNVNVLTPRPAAAPVTTTTPTTTPTAGGITNIPQERIQDYTNLFGRI